MEAETWKARALRAEALLERVRSHGADVLPDGRAYAVPAPVMDAIDRALVDFATIDLSPELVEERDGAQA